MSDNLKHSKSAVCRILKGYNETGHLLQSKNSGKPIKS